MDAREIKDRFEQNDSSINRYAIDSYVELHEQFYIFARQIDALLHDGREKAMVMTKLEEALLWSRQALDKE